MKKVYGFVLHFGYVEAAYAAQLLIHATNEGFDTLKEGVTHLAGFFARTLLASAQRDLVYWEQHEKAKWEDPKTHRSSTPPPAEPTLDEFITFVRGTATSCASEEPVFDSEQFEEWWPWDSLGSQFSNLAYYWENTDEPIERLLPHFLDLVALRTEFPQFEEFFEEVQQLQTAPVDDFQRTTWLRLSDVEKQFECVGPAAQERPTLLPAMNWDNPTLEMINHARMYGGKPPVATLAEHEAESKSKSESESKLSSDVAATSSET